MDRSCIFNLVHLVDLHCETESQADLVAWITWGLFILSLISYRLDSDTLVKLQHKSHWIAACANVNVLAQIFLLVVTGHWVLAFVRGISETIVRFEMDKAAGWMGIGMRRR
jgi:hypothetical protein